MAMTIARTLAAALTLALAAGGAAAQGRPDTTRMSCRQAAGLVQARGAVVLGTGGHTYDRFVVDRRFCQVTEAARSAFVPAADHPHCFVGYTCFEPSRPFFDD